MSMIATTTNGRSVFDTLSTELLHQILDELWDCHGRQLNSGYSDYMTVCRLWHKRVLENILTDISIRDPSKLVDFSVYLLRKSQTQPDLNWNIKNLSFHIFGALFNVKSKTVYDIVRESCPRLQSLEIVAERAFKLPSIPTLKTLKVYAFKVVDRTDPLQTRRRPDSLFPLEAFMSLENLVIMNVNVPERFSASIPALKSLTLKGNWQNLIEPIQHTTFSKSINSLSSLEFDEISLFKDSQDAVLFLITFGDTLQSLRITGLSGRMKAVPGLVNLRNLDLDGMSFFPDLQNFLSDFLSFSKLRFLRLVNIDLTTWWPRANSAISLSSLQLHECRLDGPLLMTIFCPSYQSLKSLTVSFEDPIEKIIHFLEQPKSLEYVALKLSHRSTSEQWKFLLQYADLRTLFLKNHEDYILNQIASGAWPNLVSFWMGEKDNRVELETICYTAIPPRYIIAPTCEFPWNLEGRGQHG